MDKFSNSTDPMVCVSHDVQPESVRNGVNSLLGCFYLRFFDAANRVENLNCLVETLCSTIFADAVHEPLRKAGFYDGTFCEKHDVLTRTYCDFFNTGSTKTANELRFRTRLFYHEFVDAIVEQFFKNDINEFKGYVRDSFDDCFLCLYESVPDGDGVVSLVPVICSINLFEYFEAMERYRDFEIMLETTYECYKLAYNVFDAAGSANGIVDPYFFLLPTNEKSLKIFKKIGCHDEVLHSVFQMSTSNFTLEELRENVCKLCMLKFRLENLLPSKKYMGMSFDAQKGLHIIIHELELRAPLVEPASDVLSQQLFPKWGM
jgi:hypothetical protein